MYSVSQNSLHIQQKNPLLNAQTIPGHTVEVQVLTLKIVTLNNRNNRIARKNYILTVNGL